jgi:N-acetylmuramate 1-kinase
MGAILPGMDDLRQKIEKALSQLDSSYLTSGLNLDLLHGDASARRYVRISGHASKPSLVAMILAPEQARFSEEAMRGPQADELPFLNIHRYLDRWGVRVPKVHLTDEQLGVVLLEDLGDHTLEHVLQAEDRADIGELYIRAVELLADLQARTSANRDEACLAYTRSFEFDLLRWELDHFIEFIVEADRKQTISGSDRQVVERAFDQLAETIAAWPRGFVHRDFQSRNLMFKDDEIVLIDFQDALLGPAVYDLVALLRDSYVVLEPDLVDRLIDHYLQACARHELERPAKDKFKRQFDQLTVQRKLKDAGRFVFIDRVKGNPNFLPFIPASLKYVAEALAGLEDLADCREVLAKAVVELA